MNRALPKAHSSADGNRLSNVWEAWAKISTILSGGPAATPSNTKEDCFISKLSFRRYSWRSVTRSNSLNMKILSCGKATANNSQENSGICRKISQGASTNLNKRSRGSNRASDKWATLLRGAEHSKKILWEKEKKSINSTESWMIWKMKGRTITIR